MSNSIIPLSPRKSAELISNLSQNVQINKDAVKDLAIKVISITFVRLHPVNFRCTFQLAEKGGTRYLSTTNFSQNSVHPKAEDPWALKWIFVVDTLNFCFWRPENEIGWQVEGYTGYYALCAAINRAMKVINFNKSPTKCNTVIFYFIRKKLTYLIRSFIQLSLRNS